MIEQTPKEEILDIIQAIESNPNATQRVLSERIGISLGKTNYLLKEVIKKGFVKAKSFSRNPRKLKTIKYILTNDGLRTKMRLLNHYLKIKEREYYRLKEELSKISARKQNG